MKDLRKAYYDCLKKREGVGGSSQIKNKKLAKLEELFKLKDTSREPKDLPLQKSSFINKKK